jgi:hypothetical protein
VWLKKLQNVRDLETDVQQRHLKIAATGKLFSEQMSDLDKTLARLSPLEFSTLLGSVKSPHLGSADLDEKSQEILQKIGSWFHASAEYQELLNNKIIAKQAYVVERSMICLTDLYTTHCLEQNPKAKACFTTLRSHFIRWQKHSTIIGDVNPKQQRERLYGFYEFFKTAEIFVEFVGHSSSAAVPKKNNGLGLAQLLKIPSLFTKKTRSTRLFLVAKYISDRFCLANKLAIEVTGWEHVPHLSPAESKKKLVKDAHEENRDPSIYLYAPSHRTNVADFHLISRLNLPSSIFFLNAKIVGETISHKYAKKIATWLGDRDGIVPVGDLRGSKQKRPGQRLLENLAAHVSQHIINYPQGFTALLNEILPTNRNFTSKLIAPVVDAHYPLKIVPISFDIDSAFMQDDFIVLQKGSCVRIHRPLSTRLLQLVVALEMNSATKFKHLFSLILRSFWLDHTTRFPELSLEQINERLQNKLGINILV